MNKLFPKKFGSSAFGRHKRPEPAPETPQAPPQAIVDVTPLPVVPSHHIQWLAWSNDGTNVIARAWSFQAARDAARELGEPDPIVEPAQNQMRRA